MAIIKVTAKIGDTHHPKYGLLVKGQGYDIDEQDFGDELFKKTKNINNNVIPAKAGIQRKKLDSASSAE